MGVILSPSLVILSETKDLGFWLRACPEGTEGVNSAKHLIILTESTLEILPCLPAGGGYRLRMTFTTRSPRGDGKGEGKPYVYLGEEVEEERCQKLRRGC